MIRYLVGAAVGAFGVIVVACGGQSSFACGTTSCDSSEVCVHPCCGGAPPQCVAADGSGTCPAGTTKATSSECENFDPSTAPCLPDPCTPPPPYCAPKGAPECAGSTDPENCYEACA